MVKAEPRRGKDVLPAHASVLRPSGYCGGASNLIWSASPVLGRTPLASSDHPPRCSRAMLPHERGRTVRRGCLSTQRFFGELPLRRAYTVSSNQGRTVTSKLPVALFSALSIDEQCTVVTPGAKRDPDFG
jgi:hypothetical protein